MTPALLEPLVTMVAILSCLGLPLGIVFTVKHFTFKHRELEAELEARKLLSTRDRAELEKRIERLESVVMNAAASRPPALEANARFAQVAGPATPGAPLNPDLFSAPPDRAHEGSDAVTQKISDKL